MARARVVKKTKGKKKPLVVKKKASNRPSKCRSWSNESMLQAMEAVKSGTMGVNRAALEHGVPRTSLKDRLAGRVIHGTNVGPKPYLTHEEEQDLVSFLVDCSKMGYGKRRSEVLKIVKATMKKKGRKLQGPISQGWWWRFRERWPKLTLRKGDSFSMAREKMTSYEIFNDYFDLLEETLEKHGLKDKPSQIYNCDESGMPLEHKLPRVISIKGTKKVRQVSSGNKTQITILGCCNATGQAIPPMVVFSGKRFNHDLSEGEVPGTLYGMADSGWMDQELFANWFSHHFLRHAVASRPLLLMLDGHSSHYTLELVRNAAENDVIIFCLPPHTTADSQPLDTSCFGPLKVHWSEACRQFMFANPGRVVSKFQFSKLFSEAWSKGMTINNIISGFRSTGIYPFNRNAILDKLPKTAAADVAVATVRSDNSDNSSSGKDDVECLKNSTPACDTEAPSAMAPEFPPEKMDLYERRFENGYDIFTDNDYVTWLQKYHPESVPSVADVFSSVQPLHSIENVFGKSCKICSKNFIHNIFYVEDEPPVNCSAEPESGQSTSDGDQLPTSSEHSLKGTGNTSTPNGHLSKAQTSFVSLTPFDPPTYSDSSALDSTTVSISTQKCSTSSTPCSSKTRQSNLSTPCSSKTPPGHSNLSTPCSSKTPPGHSILSTPCSSNTPPEHSNLSTPGPQSPLAEFLVYPTRVKKSTPKPANKSARILTSVESRTILEEKLQKKKEEEEAKAKKKIEREEKRLAKAEEKKRKEEEREAKKAEKAQQQKKGGKRAAKKPESGSVKTYPKRKRVNNTVCGQASSNQDMCRVCLGLYKDDIDEETGSVLPDHDWIQCSEEDCGAWSHVKCLEESAGGFVCSICQNIFI